MPKHLTAKEIEMADRRQIIYQKFIAHDRILLSDLVSASHYPRADFSYMLKQMEAAGEVHRDGSRVHGEQVWVMGPATVTQERNEALLRIRILYAAYEGHQTVEVGRDDLGVLLELVK